MHLPFSLDDLYFSHEFKSIGVPVNLKKKILTKDLFWSLFYLWCHHLLNGGYSITSVILSSFLSFFPWRKSRCLFFISCFLFCFMFVCFLIVWCFFFCCLSLVFLFACFLLRKILCTYHLYLFLFYIGKTDLFYKIN